MFCVCVCVFFHIFSFPFFFNNKTYQWKKNKCYYYYLCYLYIENETFISNVVRARITLCNMKNNNFWCWWCNSCLFVFFLFQWSIIDQIFYTYTHPFTTQYKTIVKEKLLLLLWHITFNVIIITKYKFPFSHIQYLNWLILLCFDSLAISSLFFLFCLCIYGIVCVYSPYSK